MSENQDALTRYLEGELRLVNKHVPYKRKKLCELLGEPIPYIVLRDGSIHVFDPEELKRLKQVLRDKACDLSLPIIIEYVPSDQEGFYVVNGALEVEAVSKVLECEGKEGQLILYRPQIIELRRKLRTSTTILIKPGGR
ncbi:MAG: DUF61 family protein [Thermosphaera sp.]